MSINDGFGDDLTNAEVVGNFWKWSHAVAIDYAHPSSGLYDDLVQESMIEIWRVLEAKGGKANVAATYLTIAAKGRMLAVATGKQMVGGDPTPGPRYRPQQVVVDWTDSESRDSLEGLLEAADVLDAVDWAYHHGEIVEVLNSLSAPDRAYVHQRFWQGMTDTEIAAAREVSNKMLGNRWKRTIRPVLREALDHLVGA